MNPFINTLPSSSFPIPIRSEETTTTILSLASGAHTASSEASSFTAPSMLMVILNSASPSFSEETCPPAPDAIFVTFCTAISLSTRTSMVSGPVSACIAFFVLTTGIGQLSPIALTVIIRDSTFLVSASFGTYRHILSLIDQKVNGKLIYYKIV